MSKKCRHSFLRRCQRIRQRKPAWILGFGKVASLSSIYIYIIKKE